MTPSRSLCLRLAALAATLATKELAKWGMGSGAPKTPMMVAAVIPLWMRF
jgi:hypothetical protein